MTGFGDIVHRAQAQTVTCQGGESDTPECGGTEPAWGCLAEGKKQVWVTFPEVKVNLLLPGKDTNQSQANDVAEFFFVSHLPRFLQE